MSDFSDLIHEIVSTVADETPAGEARGPVTHIPTIGRDAFKPLYGAPIERQAVVEYTAEGITRPDGTVTASRVKLTFIEAVSVLDRDKFTVPDSVGGVVTLNVLRVNAPLDPSGSPYMTEVWLGDLVGGGG